MDRRTLYVIISGIIIVLGLVLPSPEQFSAEGFRCLFLIGGILILWLTEALPLGLSSIFLTAAIPLLGIMTPGDTWKAFISCCSRHNRSYGFRYESSCFHIYYRDNRQWLLSASYRCGTFDFIFKGILHIYRHV